MRALRLQDESPRLPSRVRSASVWLDESGSPQTASRCFVIGALKTRHADDLARSLKAVRESHHHYTDELKFGRIKDSNYRIYGDVVDVLEASDARLGVLVVDGAIKNPFSKNHAKWETHADITSMLISGLAIRDEVLTVAMDIVNTPPQISMGSLVKRKVNGQLGRTCVVTALSLDSKSTDLLQAADLIAGAVFHQRFHGGNAASEKMKVAKRLALAFGTESFAEDFDAPRIKVQTLGRPLQRRTGVPH